jgi:putative ABC transport system permease protein
MVSLARATLIHEWRRFVPAVLAVAFSGLLVLVSAGLLFGLFASVAVYVDRSDADLWVGFPDTQSVDLARPIAARHEALVRMHPEVVRVESLTWGVGDWRRPDGVAISGFLVGVDPRPGSLMFGRLLTPAQRTLLETPDAVLIDASDVDKLGAHVGDLAELNKRRVRVVGTVEGLRAVGGANLLASLATARRIDPNVGNTDQVDYLLVKLRDPLRAEAVRDALQPTGSVRPFSVWTAAEFSERSTQYWLLESGAGAGFLFSAALGLIVGAAITSQTLMAAIAASMREYAALRALGVSLGRLRAVVLEQAGWVGLAGFAITLVGTALVLEVAHAHHVLMVVPTPLYGITAALLLAIAAASGLLALRALSATEPATLLR